MSIEDLVSKALQRQKRAIAKLVDLFEDARPEAHAKRADAMALLKGRPNARIVGITGTPGAGKSTLTGVLAEKIVQTQPALSIAVLAVDPASHISGGALLGDRTRISFPVGEKRLFFRSQSSDQMLGGLAPNSFNVVRLLEKLFDFVFVETVGIGQSEISIRHLSNKTYLVLQPFAGDQIQFMKAGIMEIPDAFVLNKCDEEKASRQSYYALRTSLKFARPDDQETLDIFRCSARTGFGVDAIVADILCIPNALQARAIRNRHFFTDWVSEEYGRAGLNFLKKAEQQYLNKVENSEQYDSVLADFQANFRRSFCSGCL
jgi:LAO/AO transport system kinase